MLACVACTATLRGTVHGHCKVTKNSPHCNEACSLTTWQGAGFGQYLSPGLKAACSEGKSEMFGVVTSQSESVLESTRVIPPNDSPSLGKCLVQAGPATITSTGVTATSRFASDE